MLRYAAFFLLATSYGRTARKKRSTIGTASNGFLENSRCRLIATNSFEKKLLEQETRGPFYYPARHLTQSFETEKNLSRFAEHVHLSSIVWTRCDKERVREREGKGTRVEGKGKNSGTRQIVKERAFQRCTSLTDESSEQGFFRRLSIAQSSSRWFPEIGVGTPATTVHVRCDGFRGRGGRQQSSCSPERSFTLDESQRIQVARSI